MALGEVIGSGIGASSTCKYQIPYAWHNIMDGVVALEATGEIHSSANLQYIL